MAELAVETLLSQMLAWAETQELYLEQTHWKYFYSSKQSC